MKKVYILLAVCLTLPLSVFAANTTDTIIDSGVVSMMAEIPC